MLFTTDDGHHIELSDADLDRYPQSLLSGLARIYERVGDCDAVKLDCLRGLHLRLLHDVYKGNPVPSRHMHAAKGMYVFEDANGMEVELLHYFMLDDVELVETIEADLESDMDDDERTDDFVLEVDSDTSDEWDEGIWM